MLNDHALHVALRGAVADLAAWTLAGCHHLRVLDDAEQFRCRTCTSVLDAWKIMDEYAHLAEVEHELLLSVGHYLEDVAELADRGAEPMWADVFAQLRVTRHLLAAMMPGE